MTQWLATFRQLLRRPAFAIITLLLLAVGVAVNTTVFAVVDTVLLKPLPYPAADRLVAVYEANASKTQDVSLIAPVRLEDWNRLNRTLAGVAGAYGENVTDTSTNSPERLAALRTSPRYFQVYGQKPIIGRTFNQQEETFGGPGAALLSASLWNRRFNNEARAIGSRLLLGGQAYTVVGVMPGTFVSPSIDVWLPAPLNPYIATARDARFLTGIGRMKPGVTIAQAREDLNRVQRQLGQEFPKTDKNWSVWMKSEKQQVIGDRGNAVWMAFAGTALLLILSCINIASLLIGRIYQRERELAVRASLGATRWQVAGVMLREISVIAVFGCGLGMLLSYGSISFIARIFATLPRIGELEFDFPSVLFAAGVGLVFLVSVGLLPMLQNTPTRLSEVLAQSGRSAGATRHPFQRYLLIGQFALTVILLCSAGLLLRSYYNLSAVKTGFDSHHVLTFHVGAEWSEDRPAIGRLQESVIAALRRLPGVESAGLTSALPTDGITARYQYRITELPASSESRTYTAGGRTVTPGYLAALRIPLLQGKGCPELTQLDSHRQATAVVNHAFVAQLPAGVNVMGMHLPAVGNTYAGPEIVGVVGDVREDSFSMAAAPYVYDCAVGGGWPDPEYVVRTQQDPRELIGTVRRMIQQIAPNRAAFGLQTMDEHVGKALGQTLLTAQMLSAFAVAALALAAFGLYSLTALTVTAQTREIGTKMALGAYSGQVVAEVFARAARWMGVGLLIGLAGAIAVGQVIRSFLFDVSPEDPFTFVAVALVLTFICFLATLLPAMRAASIDPIQALRME